MTTFPSAAAVTEAQPEARVAISLTDVSFAYNGVPVLEDVTLAIPEGEFVTVVGPNGGGKTTLLKLILGLLRPSKGQVRVFGEMPQRARSRVGYAPQHMGFDPRFPVTALDVVLMGRLERRLLGGYTKADKRAAVAALGEVELTESWSHPFSALSGGQRQRVLIARALVSEPDLLLLDEPMANVDPAIGTQLLDILKRLSEHMTILLVSHDLGFVSTVVESVICVNRRVVVHPTSELTGEIVRDIYGGDFRMVRHDHRCTEGGHEHG